MDSRSDFLRGFISWISGMDEEYLIGISNRGIYNRSVKDLSEYSSLNTNIGDSAVVCSFPDGNSCTLTNDFKKYKCTCPSRSICKHAIMALLYIKNNMESLFGELIEESTGNTETLSAQNFTELLDIEPKEIKRLIGDRSFEDILFRIPFGMEVKIEEGTFLTVSFIEEDVVVRFPAKESIRDSICSCKSREFCRHRAEAILHFQIEKGKLDSTQLQREKNIQVSLDVVTDIKKFVSDIIIMGLSRLPATTVEEMEQMAVICHNAGFATIEKQFRKLKSEAELYFKKNARFSRAYMLNTLTRIWNLCTAIQENQGDMGLLEVLVGKHKSAYHDIPPVKLYGMGAEGWVSKAGYEGITFYFYNTRLGKWLTYSNSRPTYYEDIHVNVSRMYKGSPPWGAEGSLEAFSKSKIKLINGKMNEEGRLSSSSETIGKILQKTDTSENFLKEMAYYDWRQLYQKLEKEFVLTFADKEENANLVLLKVSKWGQDRFDNISQIFRIPVYDVEGRKLFVSLRYSEENKPLIQKLEAFERMKHFPEMVLGKIFIEDGSLIVIPVSAYYPDGSIVNLTLD